MKAAPIKYIGTDDLSIDLFEGQYPVPNGVCYNSYLILDEKTAVMDTVDVRAADKWLKNLEQALAGREPDYLIISHMEPDHAGSLELAAKNKLESVAFCCISTGEFHFPNELAAEIAVQSVKKFFRLQTGVKKVIFNVFKDLDKNIYQKLLGAN